MKANYNEQPLRIELMPDGYHKFRFGIEQLTNGENTSFNCNEVIIHVAVTTDKVIAAVMDAKWRNGVEQKLINDYNEFKLTGENSEAETKYLEFLSERRDLKINIKNIIQ